MVALALGVTAVLPAPPAHAGRVAVIVVPPFAPADYASRGAVGLVVPGAGPTVSRAGALRALVTGNVRNSLLGERPSGPPLILLAKRPAATTIYVSLPPPGKHHNTTRYPIAIVGGGYRGLLTSSTTKLDGLASIADVAPTAVALEQGDEPVLGARPDSDAPAALEHLDTRLTKAHDHRDAATVVLAATALGFAALAVLFGSRLLARAAVLGAFAALMASLLLSSLDVYSTAALALITVGMTVVASLHRRLFVPALLAVLVTYLVVLAAWTSVNSLAMIGPHPDGGARFYGITNEVETLLLVPMLVSIALLGLSTLIPIGLLALAVVLPSATGADGGGAVVFVVALAALVFRLRPEFASARRVVFAAAAAAALVVAFVALDAAAGGHSHVARAFRGGPDTWASDFWRRLRLSYLVSVDSWHAGITVVVAAAVLVFFALRLPRFPIGEAILVALVVSILVNDTPNDILGFGAGAYLAVWAFERLRPAGAAALD
jgi:hypothetical protein